MVAMPYTIVQLVMLDQSGDAAYRMRWPAQQVSGQAPHWRVINLDARAMERFTWGVACDLLVLIMCGDLDLIPIIKKRQALGKKTLVEYNDNFYYPPARSPAAQAWKSPILHQTYQRFMQEADALMVTGPGLYALFRPTLDKPIHILKNHLSLTPEPFDQLWARKAPSLKVGWAGSDGHLSDLLATIPLFLRFLDHFPDQQIHLMSGGLPPEHIPLPPGRWTYTPPGGIHTYYAFLHNLHLGIAPLLDTPYNQCRSDIKAIEMAAHGILPIVQHAQPYLEFLAETGLPSFQNHDELLMLLIHYLDHPAQLRADAQRAHAYVQAHRLAPQRWERHDLYQSLLPAQPSGQAWPLPPGYHEVTGQIDEIPPSQRLLHQARTHWDQKDIVAALDTVDRALASNPYDPELALLELRFLHQTRAPKLGERLEAHTQIFPKDPRFYLFGTAIEKDPLTRQARWLTLAERLAPLLGKEFFFEQIMKILGKDLRTNPLFLPAGERFLAIFPEQAALRLALAQAYAGQRQFHLAHPHYAWLVDHAQFFQANQTALPSLDLPLLTMWRDGLAN